MSWRQSLIRISKHEVETLQKRLGEIVERRLAAELRLTVLEAEAESELAESRRDAELGWSWPGFLAGVKLRRAHIAQQIETIRLEESGARDALGEAFESLKKFEHVAELARLANVKETARRETVMLDELGLRAATR